MRHLSPTFFFIYNFSLAKDIRYLITLTYTCARVCERRRAHSYASYLLKGELQGCVKLLSMLAMGRILFLYQSISVVITLNFKIEAR